VLWIRAASDVRAGLTSAIAASGATPRIVSRYDALAALRDAPLEAVIARAYMAALIVATIYMALAIVAAMVLSVAGRTRDLAYLRTLGITARQALGLTVMEHGPPVILAVIPGVGLGIAIAFLVEPGLGLSTFVGISGVPLYVDWLALAAMSVALIGVVALAVGIGTWLARRVRPTDALRIGET
jgi:putative ABC transport system permease protein